MPPEMVVLLWRGLADGFLRRGTEDLQGGGTLREQVAKDVEEEAQQVGNDGYEQNELGELGGAPGALEIAAAVEDGEPGHDQAQHILLDNGSQRKHPRIDDRDAGHDGEVGHAVAHAGEGLLDLLDQAGLRAQHKVEQGTDDNSS